MKLKKAIKVLKVILLTLTLIEVLAFVGFYASPFYSLLETISGVVAMITVFTLPVIIWTIFVLEIIYNKKHNRG